MKNSIQAMLTNLKATGEDDYVQLWIVLYEIADSLGIDLNKIPPDQAKQFWSVVSELITKMLEADFIAVDLTKDGGYTAWPEQATQQVMTKITNEWIKLDGKFPDVGFIFWFNKLDNSAQ